MEVVKTVRHTNQEVAERLREIANDLDASDDPATGWGVVIVTAGGEVRSKWGGNNQLALVGAMSTIKHDLIRSWEDT